MGLKEKMAEAMMEKMDPAEKRDMMAAMMDKFLAEMSGPEKREMMEAMMEKFMGGLKTEDRLSMMKAMMPKMMTGAEGAPDMTKMMGMMSRMMGGRGGEDKAEMPWDMCKKMMATIGKSSELATFATPELRGLFEDWAGQIEEEILEFISESAASDPQRIAERFKISPDSVNTFLTRLAQKGKITLRAERK